MKAKDTVINPQEYPLNYLGMGLQELLTKQSEITWEAAFKAGYHQRELDPLDKEDRCEKCYQQGIKEVVDWVERWALVGLLEKTQEKWERQKKEWGIE